MIFAVVATLIMLGIAGCTKDAINDHTDDIEEFTLISYAAAPDTRMVINGDKQSGFATAWEADDKIGVYAMPESTEGIDNIYFTCNKAHSAKVTNGMATFTGLIRSTNNADYNLFAYYPYTPGSGVDEPYQSAVKCSIATTQTMNGNSFDKSCAYMVAKTGKTINTEKNKSNTETVNWQFRHTVTFINLTTKSISATSISGDEVVKSVAIEAAGKTLGGNFLFNLENGTMTFTEPQSAITTIVPNNTKLSDLSAWLVANPFELTVADDFIVTITTNLHKITKTVHLAKSFDAANVYTLNLAIDNQCAVVVTYALTFPDDNKANNKTSYYTKTWTAKIGDYSWTIANFSNNQWNNNWKYIKCGNSNAASIASISTDWAIAEAVVKVTVNISSLTPGMVNSIKLEVATDKAFANVLQTIDADKVATGNRVFTIPHPTTDCYYRILFDCKKGNNSVGVSTVVYTNIAD